MDDLINDLQDLLTMLRAKEFDAAERHVETMLKYAQGDFEMGDNEDDH